MKLNRSLGVHHLFSWLGRGGRELISVHILVYFVVSTVFHLVLSCSISLTLDYPPLPPRNPPLRNQMLGAYILVYKITFLALIQFFLYVRHLYDIQFLISAIIILGFVVSM